MAGQVADIWSMVSIAVHLGGACAAAVASAMVFQRKSRFGLGGWAIAVALALTASWCLAIAATGPLSGTSGLAETVRNIAWLAVIYRLFANDDRHKNVPAIRWVVGALAYVELINPAMLLLIASTASGEVNLATVFHIAVLLRLLTMIGGLVLVHNLYVGGSPQTRMVLRWPTAAVAVMWGFDLNFYTVAYLGEALPAELGALRGIVAVAGAVLLAVGAARGSDGLRFKPSRAVAFQSVSLSVIGAYLLAMVGISQWMSFADGAFARLMQFGFVLAASVVALLVLPSRRLRGWLQVMLAKHFFQHRYDYRAEWLRFTRTIGRGGEDALPLQERAVQALADIADSAAGLLLAPSDTGQLTLAARWQWATADVPAEALPDAAIAFFEKGIYIIDLDDVRSGHDLRGESAILPAWLIDEPQAWALVPLLHYDRLVGVVVLARPAQARKLDWEDFDLLRVVSQQLASYLAESTVQEALAEAGRFDDFHRRIAFVMHDIKNLASQLSLLARNAELHAENPAFRADMLLTLRNSADKLNTLLARLSRYGTSGLDTLTSVAVDDVVAAVADQFRVQHPVHLVTRVPCEVSGNRETLEQVLVHLVQNAIDASAADAPVMLGVVTAGAEVRIEVVDSGCGMSPDFVRTKLFKPFVSSKQGGFGIGAFEARELVQAMRGRLEVDSREGIGSRFTVCLAMAVVAEDSGDIAGQRAA